MNERDQSNYQAFFLFMFPVFSMRSVIEIMAKGVKTSKLWPVLLLALSASAAAPPADRVVQAEMSAIDFSGIQGFLDGLDQEIRPYMPDYRPNSGGGGGFDPGLLVKRILNKLLGELALNAHLLGELVFLAVLCALLSHLSGSFASQNVSQLAFYVCYLVMMGLAAKSFFASIQLGRAAVDNMANLMYAMLPVVCSLLAAVGAAATSVIFHPLMIGAVTVIARLVQTVIFPLAILTMLVTLVGHLAEGFSLSKLASLLKTVTIGFTGLLLAGFVGLISVRGVAAAAADGVGLRTAKYVSGTFVPIVGKGMSDAMEAVAGCSLLLKNTIGGFGAWSLIVLVAFPLVKILVLVGIYRLAAALVQPLGENRLVEALNAIGGGFTVIFAVTALIGLAFFLGLTILVALGNLSYALR